MVVGFPRAVAAASSRIFFQVLNILHELLFTVQQVFVWVPMNCRPGEGIGPSLIFAFLYKLPAILRPGSTLPLTVFSFALRFMAVFETIAVVGSFIEPFQTLKFFLVHFQHLRLVVKLS